MTDTAAASIVVDHPFQPREQWVFMVPAGRYDHTPEELNGEMVKFPPNLYLCQHCRLAEAAHRT